MVSIHCSTVNFQALREGYLDESLSIVVLICNPLLCAPAPDALDLTKRLKLIRSGKNKIPDIKTFVQNLDKDKRERDQRLDEARKAGNTQGDAKPHQATKAGKEGTLKTVTDPTTGKEVQIEDVDTNYMKAVEDPQLSVPNANLGKDTTVKTDASQKNPEYAHNQDITAPPDPLAQGSTSDVPIHGEKTNILFHPTPSVSYEPMFAALEKRGGSLCLTIFGAIIILGKMFGASLKGLIPTAFCIASGVWLWMKELVRSGREMEWSSEQSRGETVCSTIFSHFSHGEFISNGWNGATELSKGIL